MFRRDFLKALAWLFGGSQVGCGAAADRPAEAGPPGTRSDSDAQAQRAGAATQLIAGDFDLIVVGGGLSGTAAAISAARNGVRVALVHERSMLGGNSASEVRLYPENNDGYQPWIRESGLHEEFHLEDRVRSHLRYREGMTNWSWDITLYEACVRGKNLTP